MEGNTALAVTKVQAEIQSEIQLEEDIGTLYRYSFLLRRSNSREEGNEEEWYDIHRLVHLATKI
jgi:hypothetical protein